MSGICREERLFLAIGGVEDALVAEAAGPVPARRHSPWLRWGTMAAALALVAGAGLWGVLPRMGGASAGGSGVRQEANDAVPGAMAFMSYAGPVLPLTVLDGPEGLPAEREVTWDFGGAAERNGVGRAEITDQTVLHNDGNQAVTLRVGCPAPADLASDEELIPTLSVDGEVQEVTLTWGSTGLRGEAPKGSWEDYRLLMVDDGYLREAEEEPPALDYTVTVWEVSGADAPGRDDKNMAPTLAVTFRVDESRTRVLTYGFNGLSVSDDGTRRYDYFIPRSGEKDQRRLLIFVGEAPEEYVMEGYTDGGCEVPLEGVTATLSAFTANLGELLDRLAEDNLRRYRQELLDRLAEAQTEARRMMARLLAREEERFDAEALEDLLSYALLGTRVVWSTAEVTVPAGGAVTVTASYQKEPSYDFACADTRRRGLCGFDLATRLGSSLRFTAITARLAGAGDLLLEEQDFGFRPEGGSAQVSLDPAKEHYYMVLRRRGE